MVPVSLVNVQPPDPLGRIPNKRECLYKRVLAGIQVVLVSVTESGLPASDDDHSSGMRSHFM